MVTAICGAKGSGSGVRVRVRVGVRVRVRVRACGTKVYILCEPVNEPFVAKELLERHAWDAPSRVRGLEVVRDWTGLGDLGGDC